MVFDLVNAVLPGPGQLSEMEREYLGRLFLASKSSFQEAISQRTGRLLLNCMFFIVEKANDLPAWFYLNNPFVKTLMVVKPDREERERFAAANLGLFDDIDTLSFEERERVADEFGALSIRNGEARLPCLFCSTWFLWFLL